MNELNKPHDAFFKGMLSKKENAKSFLENYLPPDVLGLINLEHLELEKDSFITEELQQYFSDLLYKVQISGKKAFIYVLFEHKSYNEKWISLQLLEYILRIWKLKKEENKALPAIIPIVVHHGEEKWTAGTKLSDLIGHSEETLLRYMPEFEYILHDVPKYEDEQIIGTATLKAMFLLLKYVHSPLLSEKLWMILKLLKNNPESDYIVMTTMYILNATKIPWETFIETVKKNMSEREGELAMTTAELLIQKGEQIGLQKGRQEGRQEGEQIGLQKGEQIGLQKGEQIGLQKGKIEALLEVMFGDLVSLRLMPKIRGIEDIDKLVQIQKSIKQAKNESELEKMLEKM